MALRHLLDHELDQVGGGSPRVDGGDAGQIYADGAFANLPVATEGTYERYDPTSATIYHYDMGPDGNAHQHIDGYHASPTIGYAFSNSINDRASIIGLNAALATAFGTDNVGRAVDLSHAGAFVTAGIGSGPVSVGVYVDGSLDFGLYGGIGFGSPGASSTIGLASNLSEFMTGWTGSATTWGGGIGFNRTSGAVLVGDPNIGYSWGISIPDTVEGDFTQINMVVEQFSNAVNQKIRDAINHQTGNDGSESVMKMEDQAQRDSLTAYFNAMNASLLAEVAEYRWGYSDGRGDS